MTHNLRNDHARARREVAQANAEARVARSDADQLARLVDMGHSNCAEAERLRQLVKGEG